MGTKMRDRHKIKIKKFQVRFSHPDIFGKRIVQDRVIFDTEQEAEEWIEKVGDPSLKVERILGIIVNRSSRCGLLTARNERVWVPIEEAERCSNSG